MILSLQFSWKTKKAGGRKKVFLLFKRKEKGPRIILIRNSFKEQLRNRLLSPPNSSFHSFKQNRHLCHRFFLLA